MSSRKAHTALLPLFLSQGPMGGKINSLKSLLFSTLLLISSAVSATEYVEIKAQRGDGIGKIVGGKTSRFGC